MPGLADPPLWPTQATAREQLRRHIGPANTAGRSLCCLVGATGTGKTVLARAVCSDPTFGTAQRLPVNALLLERLGPLFPELGNQQADTLVDELRKYGSRVQDEVQRLVRERLLDDGLTILDHLELLFVLGLDPVTLWYADAIGSRRVLLVFTGRVDGQLCLVGHRPLRRAGQPVVELEAAR
jgi:hypothetical protein